MIRACTSYPRLLASLTCVEKLLRHAASRRVYLPQPAFLPRPLSRTAVAAASLTHPLLRNLPLPLGLAVCIFHERALIEPHKHFLQKIPGPLPYCLTFCNTAIEIFRFEYIMSYPQGGLGGDPRRIWALNPGAVVRQPVVPVWPALTSVLCGSLAAGSSGRRLSPSPAVSQCHLWTAGVIGQWTELNWLPGNVLAHYGGNHRQALVICRRLPHFKRYISLNYIGLEKEQTSADVH